MCCRNVFSFFFLHFSFLSQSDHFAKAIAFAKWPFFGNFQNGLIFRALAVFSSRFLHRTTAMCCRDVFSMFFFFHFSFLTQSVDFTKAIAFTWWPFLAIFKMV